MKLKTLVLSTFLCASFSVMALDPFSVYTANAPENCVDKELSTKKLTLPDLITIGVCNNPSLSKDFMAIKIKEASVGQAKATYLPTVKGSASISKRSSKTEGQTSLENEPLSANVALNWLLFDFGGRISSSYLLVS